MRADFSKLDRAFNPGCIAVIGDSSPFQWLQAESNFKGKLYSVHVNAETAQKIESRLKIKNYASLLDVPDDVDLAVVTVNRRVAPTVLDDCIRKKVAAAHFFTSGYSETDTEEGRVYERQLKDKAEAAGFHLIGPNCMGIFNPVLGVRQVPPQYYGVSGPVGLISQSGTHAVAFSVEAHLVGLDINKSVSYGNGIVLDSPEFLEYFGQDENIKIIGMYIEGLRNGKRFIEALKKVTARKPVVIWKGGRTEGGFRAIASHTGALAGSQAVWDSAMRQCGAVPVKTLEELIDTIKALLKLKPPEGDRVGLTGGSGGQSVAVTDAFNETGLDVPTFTESSLKELATFYNIVGGGISNPIDTGNSNRDQLNRIIDVIERDENIDNIVVLMGLRIRDSDVKDNAPGGVDFIVDLAKKSPKPVMTVVGSSFLKEGAEEGRRIILKLEAGGVPAFPSMERAARALKNTIDFYRRKK